MSLADPYGASGSGSTPRAGSAAGSDAGADAAADADDWLLSSDDGHASEGEGEEDRRTPPAGPSQRAAQTLRAPRVPTMGEREWRRVEAKFEDAGYRDGITAGKTAALQGAFDSGFALVGAPLGRRLGQLRGRAAAQLAVLVAPASSRGMRPGGVRVEAEEGQTEALQELRALIGELARTKLERLAPPDIEAQRHAAEDEGREASEIRDESAAERAAREAILDGLEARLDAVLRRIKRPQR